MDRTTIFTKTAKGLMEATGKTSVLSRDLRALLKEIDGRATVAEVQARFGKLPEPKLQESLNGLAKDDFIREFSQPSKTAAPLPKGPAAAPPKGPTSAKGPAASEEMDLDFTMAIPTLPIIAKQAEEAARQKAQAAAAVEAAARARAEADARARAAAAEAAARARAEADVKAKAEALEKAKAAAAEAAARARAEADARARVAAEVAAHAKAKAEAETRARAEAEARAKAEAEARAKQDAEEKARREAEARARQEAEARAKAEEQARIEADARTRKEAEERARVEAELKARLEDERRAREEAERKAKEEAERERKEVEAKARREADELRAKLEEERTAREQAERKAKDDAARESKARDEAERKAKEEAERERKEVEAKARREVDELRAKLEEERNAREDAERKAKEQTERERKARDEVERKAKEQGERERNEMAEKARREADELRAQLEQERKTREEVEGRAKEEAQRQAREDAERSAREHAERVAREAEARELRDAEERSRKVAEDKARTEADAGRAAEENAQRTAAEPGKTEATPEPGPSLDDLVKIEIDFDAVQSATKDGKSEVGPPPAGADDSMLKALEEKARRDAEEKARLEAEEKARIEAEAKEQKEQDERRRKAEPAAQPMQVKDRAIEQPVAQEQEYAAEKAQLDAQHEETERHFADMEKELEAETAAAKGEKELPEPRQDARKRDKATARESVRAEVAVHADEDRAATEETRVVYRTPINWGKPVALALFLILILGVVLIHFVSFDGRIPQFEKLAGTHLQQPVKIKALHLTLLPLPHWRLDGVAVGNEGQLAVAQIRAFAALGSMFSDQMMFKSIELESPVLSEQGLIALLFGKSQGQDFKVASVIVRNGKLDSKTIALPVLDAKIALGEDGAWQKIALETPDHKTSLLLEPKGEGAQLEVETNAFSMPFGPAFILENFSAKGVIGRNELRLSEFKGAIHGGYLAGNASLKWGTDWSLGGEISARAMDPGSTAPALLEDGKLEGKAVYAMRAKSYDELFAAPRLEGTFAVQKGSLLGVDLARLLQSGGVGGKTAFTELSGTFVRDGGRTQLRQVRLGAGPVSAGGSADVDAGKNISGRFAVELKSPVAQARANLTVSGTLREPRFNR